MGATSNKALVGKHLAAVLPKTSEYWFRQSHLLKLNLLLLVPLLSSAASGFDGSMMNGLQSLDTWNDFFGKPTGASLGLMNAISPLGAIIGCALASWLSEAYGRKLPMLIGIMIVIVSASLQAAAQNFATFTISRFFIGLGAILAAVPGPVLITEVAYPTHRAKMTALYNTFYYVGAIASSWTTFGTFKIANSWSWRIPSLLQAFFPLLQLLAIWKVPESPRWLVSKGRIQEARRILMKYHAGGDASSPLVEYELTDIKQHIIADGEVSTTGWACLWATPADRKRLAIIIFIGFIGQWAGNGVVSYYLSLILDGVGITSVFAKTLINGLLQIFNSLAAVGGALLCDKAGRRRLWLTSAIGMLCAYIGWTAASAVNENTRDKGSGMAVVALIFVYFFFYDIAMTPLLFAYPAEILPFQTRQKGIAVVTFSAYSALLFNMFVNPIALEAIQWRYYFTYIVLLVILVGVVFMYFPETKGLPLEEISELFEGKKRVWQRRNAVLSAELSGKDGVPELGDEKGFTVEEVLVK